ncbi:MAG: hypothetical protein QME75_02085 [Deltaproteobacteria bacterium]|nr:hypothetical protein [Deltaproteobacteria bacterium]
MVDLIDDDKLTPRDKIEIAFQAGLQLIPCGLGGALSSIYFGIKQEKRFKRIELFYSEVANELIKLKENDLKEIRDRIDSLNIYEKESLSAIIEELNDKIEREHIFIKITYFKQYFLNILKNPNFHDEFDEKKYFLNIISSMTIIEFNVLAFLYTQKEKVNVGDIPMGKVDPFAIIGAVERLKSFGFIKSYPTYSSLAGDLFKEQIQISSFGLKFGRLCLH